jgi:hypothetical protein
VQPATSAAQTKPASAVRSFFFIPGVSSSSPYWAAIGPYHVPARWAERKLPWEPGENTLRIACPSGPHDSARRTQTEGITGRASVHRQPASSGIFGQLLAA